MDNKGEGSYAGGFILALLLGFIGLIIALCVGQEETRKGALHGFLFSIVITVVVIICIYQRFCSALSEYLDAFITYAYAKI